MSRTESCGHRGSTSVPTKRAASSTSIRSETASSSCARDGYTLVPLSVYLSGSHVKVELGLCRGKKLYDKREADAKKQAGREIEREMKERSR